MHRESGLTIDGKQYGPEELMAFANQKLKEKNLKKWEVSFFSFLKDWYNNSPVILQNTSGSTGEAKTISLAKQAMRNSAHKTLHFFELKPLHTALLSLSADYIAGKMMIVRAIEGKLNLLLTEPTGTPEIPNRKINFAAMVPLQVKQLLQRTDQFKNISILIIGGAEVDNELLSSFEQLSTKVYATYGMTETCSHIAVKALNGNNREDTYSVMEGVKITLNDRNCIVIHAPYISDKPFITNDIGKIQPDGKFEWLGRADFVINSGGIKVNPEKLEQKIHEYVSREGYIVPLPDPKLGQKIVFVVEGIITPVWGEETRTLLREKLGAQLSPKAVISLEKFPRTQNMKIDRKRLISEVLIQNP